MALVLNYYRKQRHQAIDAQVSAFPCRRASHGGGSLLTSPLAGLLSQRSRLFSSFHSARETSSPRSRGASVCPSSYALARPFSQSALSAARIRLCVGTGSNRLLRKHEHQLVSKLFADLNHAASPLVTPSLGPLDSETRGVGFVRLCVGVFRNV